MIVISQRYTHSVLDAVRGGGYDAPLLGDDEGGGGGGESDIDELMRDPIGVDCAEGEGAKKKDYDVVAPRIVNTYIIRNIS